MLICIRCGLLPAFQATSGLLYICCFVNPCQRKTLWKKGHTQHIHLQFVIYFCLSSIFGLNNPPKISETRPNFFNKKQGSSFGIELYSSILGASPVEWWFCLPCLALHLKLVVKPHKTPRYIPLIPQRITSPFWMPAMSVVPLSRLTATTQICLGIFTPILWGNDPIWWAYCSNWLVQPPSSCCYWFLYCFFSFRYPRISFFEYLGWWNVPDLKKTYRL